jgi:pimeloyl-ACP methyl ester carboxylesterase
MRRKVVKSEMSWQANLVQALLIGAVCFSSSLTLHAQAQSASAQSEAPVYTKALGIALESYDYPYRVEFMQVEVEGQRVRLAYMDVRPTGNANGRTVVLLHGKNFYGSYWESTIRALTSAGFRVVVPDQLGFGKSSKPEIHYSFDLLAANTAQLLDQLKVDRAAVVGHSMGGMLAVRFARNYPERTTHLVLENPIGLEDYRFKVPPQPIEKIFQNELNDTDTSKIRAFLRNYVVEWKPEVYERFVEVRSRVTLSGEYTRWARASALTYQMIYQQPVRHEFILIKTKTLLIIGQEDRTTLGRGLVSPEVLKTLGQYPRLGKEAARDIPGAQLLELNNIGHLPHLEAPEKFQQALLDFLKS